ncbi:MAG: ATP-binding cassette domain-containing protein [Octadecabacter sp.]|nr:ATP-binding cassette domain-containing protein [Octadecabacter sp.]
MLWCRDAVFVQGGYTLSANLKVKANKVTAVIGPSGAGKSTLLGGIAGFVTQQSGTLSWNDLVINILPPHKRPISMLFQDNNLFPHLTVMQNVALALGTRLNPAPDVQNRIEDVLTRVGLKDLANRKPATLSGGQQSRATLARALLQDREIMLMDEPFSALGPGMKAEMLDLSVELAKAARRTIVMVTHDPADAARVADEVIGIVSGNAWAPIVTKQFLNNPPKPFINYLG